MGGRVNSISMTNTGINVVPTAPASVSKATKMARHAASLSALFCVLLLNVSLHGTVAASPAPTPTSVASSTAYGHGASWSVDTTFYVAALNEPEDTQFDWPAAQDLISTALSAPDCVAAIEAKASKTVFHFETHQSVLGPEYFGQLQRLADQVSTCPGAEVMLEAITVPVDADQRLSKQRKASILRILARKGYDVSRFHVGHETNSASIIQASLNHVESGAAGRIEFSLIRQY